MKTAAAEALLTAAAGVELGVPDMTQLTLAARQRASAVVPIGVDPGVWYEQLLGFELYMAPRGLEVRRATARRATGAYYTDPAVVEYLLERTLQPLLAEGSIGRLLDPAAGSGAFVAGAAAYLRRAGVPAEQAARALWACDLDGDALALCAAAASAAAGTGVTREQFRQLDALTADLPGQFDAVVGNPPYIASGLRGVPSPDPTYAAALRARYPQAGAYKLNTYPLFLQRGVDLLRPGGRLGFVVPDSLLMGKYFASLRRLLLETCCIEEVTLICRDFWAHGRVGQTLLVVLRREPDAGRRAAHMVRVRRVERPGQLSAGGQHHALPQAGFVAAPLARWRLFFTAADARFAAALEGHPAVSPLAELLFTYSGLIGRAGQRSLLRSSYPSSQVTVEHRGRRLFSGTPAPGAWQPLLASGAEIDRYHVQWQGESVLLEPVLIKSGGRLDHYRQPKLLLRQTADRLVVAYDDTGLFCLNNIHLVLPRRGFEQDLRYYQAILNSTVFERYWRLLALEQGRLYPQIDLDMLALLPLRTPGGSAAEQRTRAELVSVAEQLERCRLQAKERPSLLARADQLVRSLYDLTGDTHGSS